MERHCQQRDFTESFFGAGNVKGELFLQTWRSWSETNLFAFQHLTHKNIALLLNSFYKDNKLYLVMEFMQDNLNNIIRTQRLQSDDIRYIIYQILSGLNYLHNCGIIHGDLKPSDIGINKDFTAKIIDLNVEQPKEADYVLTKWFVEILREWTMWKDFSSTFFAGIGRQRFCSVGKHQRRKLIYGVWAALWLSSYVEESFLPDVIVSFPSRNFLSF